MMIVHWYEYRKAAAEGHGDNDAKKYLFHDFSL